MANARKPRRLLLSVSLVILGCGGRSDVIEDYEEGSLGGAGGADGHGGNWQIGGSASNTLRGGSAALGGWSTSYGGWVYGGSTARGGWTSLGGTPAKGGASYYTYGGSVARGGSTTRGGSTARGGSPPTSGTTGKGGYSGATGYVSGAPPRSGAPGYTGGVTSSGGSSAIKQACCVAHPFSTGCSIASVEQCVCAYDAVCCSIGWDAECVRKVMANGCGTCTPIGTGGTSGTGGAPSTGGGGVNTGGAPFTAGSPPIGGSGAAGGNLASGGVFATGGAPTGGAPTGGVPATGGSTAAPQWMIDDVEDGNGDILSYESRQGYWRTFNDGTQAGVQEPTWDARIFSALAITDRPGSNFAVYTRGSGFTDWGAGLCVYLKGTNSYYNANKYRGITFWGKVENNTSNVVRMNVSDDQTEEDGNVCVDCWDFFGVDIVMTATWQRYSYTWSQLKQQGWGAPIFGSINPAKLRRIEFGAPNSVFFGLYIDDLGFIP
ncbi:MAG TPA: hypothetical protein VIV60_29980 [Polyangiaceae bacterium]